MNRIDVGAYHCFSNQGLDHSSWDKNEHYQILSITWELSGFWYWSNSNHTSQYNHKPRYISCCSILHRGLYARTRSCLWSGAVWIPNQNYYSKSRGHAALHRSLVEAAEKQNNIETGDAALSRQPIEAADEQEILILIWFDFETLLSKTTNYLQTYSGPGDPEYGDATHYKAALHSPVVESTAEPDDSAFYLPTFLYFIFLSFYLPTFLSFIFLSFCLPTFLYFIFLSFFISIFQFIFLSFFFSNFISLYPIFLLYF